MTKFVFVTGGVVSSLGKGITAAALGCLLKSRGLKVAIQKFDPYINPDPGTLSPLQQGEVFVTDDGAETDLDLGHYERFVDINLTRHSSTSMGNIYKEVLQKERQGFYDGATVQVIPHVTTAVKERILYFAENGDFDVVISEIGGTVGDIESLPYLEAIRQLRQDLGRQNTLYIHVTLVPYIRVAGEAKTKPTQHSVKELRSIGIQPDIIVCRSEYELSQEIRDKIALFCDIDEKAVVQAIDAENIYEVPLNLARQNFDLIVADKLNLQVNAADLDDWKEFCRQAREADIALTVGLVGKYIELPDAYLSIAEALRHAAIYHNVKLNVRWIDSHNLTEENYREELAGLCGILLPDGFGRRGLYGKELAARYARENDIPFLGIGLGMHMALLDFAKNVAGLGDLCVPECNPEARRYLLKSWQPHGNGHNIGGTLRKGLLPVSLEENSLAARAYGCRSIKERHRHRYEVDKQYLPAMEEKGLKVSGRGGEDGFVAVIELPFLQFFVGVQYHPEFKSRPQKPHPLFRDFIYASLSAAQK